MENLPVIDCSDGYVRAAGVATNSGPQKTKTAAYQILESDVGTTFDNLGATGSVAFTLPPLKYSRKGDMFAFQVKVVGQTITVTSPTAATMAGVTNPYLGVTYTSNGASQYGYLELYFDGTSWYPMALQGTWPLS